LFRIDRNYVNLGVTRLARVENGDSAEADAIGESLNAAASTAYATQAQVEAQEMLREAHATAEKLLEDARDQAAIILFEAREKAAEDSLHARQEGFEKGAAEGKRSFDKELAEKISEDDAMLKRVIEEVLSEQQRVMDSMEEELVGLSLNIVRKIIHPADEAIGGVFEPLIRNVLRQMTPSDKLILRVSPADYDRFFAAGNAVFELDSGATLKASVMRDVSLGENDLIIDSSDETLNAGLESQLKQIQIAFEAIR